jgi:HK97 family phage prohead protease
MTATGLMSMLMAPRPSVAHPLLLKGRGGELMVAGYASVELVDKQGDLIKKDALNEAFSKFMRNPQCRNVQLAHSNIQVGEVVPNYTDTNGRMWKSEVDDTGMFVVIKLRNDIEKAREVASEIRKGNLRSFSIGGQAFERINKTDQSRGDYREISRMELHEVTICEKGINPEAQFRILKEDRGNIMTAEETALTELHTVLDRLSKRLDDVERADDEDTEKGKMPPWLDGDDDGKKKKKGDDKKKPTKDDDDDDDNGDDDDTDMAYSDMDDVISTDYLTWLESTVKSAGFDTGAARSHFDGVEKGYDKGQHGYDHRGQGSIEGAGEDDSKKRPKMNFGSGGTGNKNVIKAGYVTSDTVSEAQVEEAYSVYKAAAEEQQFKSTLGDYFSGRFSKEQQVEMSESQRQAFDARAPLVQVEKAILALSSRIDTLSSDSGETFTKSANAPTVTIPETGELASMSWDEVHALAGRALRGGDN